MLIDHQPKDVMNDGGIAGFVQYTEYRLIAYEIEQLVNQEVEKRIAERMPIFTEIIQKAEANSKIKLSDRERIFIRMTYNMLRSHLTCSEKPNNSQKTEGGGE